MSDYPVKCPKKLIEVALPLEAINLESLRRKQKAPKGWPTSFHKWWAQRPIAAARAVLFAQLVNDPGYERHLQRGVNKELAAMERDRLFKIIEKLVLWDNTSDERVLSEARNEIWKSWRETCRLNKDHPQASELFDPETLPPFHDPFAGSGSIPISAQWLGLETYASDLNPVSVLINKALIEIPSRFPAKPPVNPKFYNGKHLFSRSWTGSQGLADDVRYYGNWIRSEAEKRIGHLYPRIEVTGAMATARPDLKRYVGKQLTVIAWLWARTVKSPNPAFATVDVPLASTFMLATRAGKEAYVEPIFEESGYHFTVRVGKPKDVEAAKRGTSAGKRKAFTCLMSGVPIAYDYIRKEAKSGRMGQRLMTIVAEGERGRVYLSPTTYMESLAQTVVPQWQPNSEMPTKHRDFKPPVYGMNNLCDIFTKRQLVALATFSDLVQEVRAVVKQDALSASLLDDNIPLANGGAGATAYADAICTYLACVLDRMVYYGSNLTSWLPKDSALRDCMPRQVLAMTWDFAECNPLGKSSGDILTCTNSVSNYLDVATPSANARAIQHDAQSLLPGVKTLILSTDPPYYDNISYADLSDFFYVWLRRSLKPVFPELFATLAVPKAEELVASPHRHGGTDKAETFFLHGMTKAMNRLAEQSHPAFPVTIYYAFKQSDSDGPEETSNTGWDTFLAAVIEAGFAITGTWPMRTEGEGRMIASGTNALASSIVLVCRKRPEDAPTISRREFIRELNEALPLALDEMTRGGVNSPVAAVDLSQAIIGPGMAIFSKYATVLEADGSRMSVRTALQLINRFLAEDDFDHDTQFCLHWFENYGWSEGKFGEADVLARAKGTSVDGVRNAGVLASAKGIVQLFRWHDYPADWAPESDQRTPIWEALHQMIRTLQRQSAADAGSLLARMPTRAEPMRQLAYRLYTICERKGWAEDARAYNELITSWIAIERASQEVGHVGKQTEMDV